AQSIETTEEAITSHMQNLKELRKEKEEIIAFFEDDIKRLRELKGVAPEVNEPTDVSIDGESALEKGEKLQTNTATTSAANTP
ncbi:MAG: hypothetical protein HKM24_03030, partial [Gammaproteobacteria bacterium]|nr:hypothetical protein [Gammaproteobacteria bacterium]